MGKIIIFLFLVIATSFSLFSQEWERDFEVEDVLYEFDIDIEVWVFEDYDTLHISFEDYESVGWSRVRYKLSSILTFLELRGSMYDIIVSDMSGISIVYTWFDDWDEDWDEDDYYENGWEIVMDSLWLNRFYKSRRTDRTLQINSLVRVLEVQHQSENDSYLKEDLEQYSDKIIQQNFLQQELDLRPNEKRK